MYAKVIIEYKVKKLDKEFIYKVPRELRGLVRRGMKVIVPFGHQTVAGFITEIIDELTHEEYDVKPIDSIVDEELILDEELMDLGNYLKESTMCTLMTAYQAMLPVGLKVKKNNKNYELTIDYIALTDEKKACEYQNNYPRRVAQNRVIDELLKSGELLKSNFSNDVVKALLENDIIKIIKKQTYRINKTSENIKKTLSSDQEKVYDRIIAKKDMFNPFLLYGVTGSGKTEIYIKVVENIISSGKSAIILVPEISLTTQIAKRFYEAFGSDVAILHSNLSAGEKYDEYLKIYRGDVHVVVGTRSAIFAPTKNLGVIIIDEEDSASFKQDNNPKYHAKDVAIYRAKYNNIPVVLASATPSLEAKARADKGVYELLRLDKRIGTSILPTIHLVDMEPEMKKRNTIFSSLLKEKIQEKLEKNEQVILLLNRRGFSTFITCSNCGFTYKCPECDITLTYHKTTNNLICHYCGYKTKKDNECPSCHEEALNYYGLGTEKLEEKICELYAGAKVVRMDQDTTRNKGAHEKIINDFKEHKYDILLGTQMISKGLDFPLVTLVGVINADTTLNIPDYKSSENTFALLSQVAGRSGRSQKLGEVIIQTFNPDNYVLKCAKLNNYDLFYNQEMKFRHRLKYPPYFYLVGLKVIGKSYENTIKESSNVKRYLDQHLSNNFIILGPTTASVFKFKNEYRMQIVIKYKKEENLKTVLQEVDNILMNSKDVYLEIDFNPLNI